MCLPSGEKYGFDSSPGCAVSRRAPVPSEFATQMSSPYTNAIFPSVIAGEARSRVSDVSMARAAGHGDTATWRKNAALKQSEINLDRFIVVFPVRPAGPEESSV